MKTYIKLALSLLMLIGIGCGHNVEKQDSFTPPAIKFQPRLFYPKSAQDNAFYGISKILVQINKTGNVDKVYLLKSSGYPLLDSSATVYCHDVTFIPAVKNGEPIVSRMMLNIKFDLSNNVWNTKDYIQDIQSLYSQAKVSDSAERSLIEKEILKWHSEFLDQTKDISLFSSTIAQVISENLMTEWKDELTRYPLSFLLYHDFIQNFGDYNNMAAVKTFLLNALKCDIQYIKTVKIKDESEIQKRDNLLKKIKVLVINKYPEFPLEDLGFSKISS